MASRWRRLSIIICMVSLSLLAAAGRFPVSGQTQDETTAATSLDLINEARLHEGLDPYSQSRLLTAAAQRHADDIAENGFPDPDDIHRGSDGSSHQERIEEAGYTAWTEDEETIVTEIVWAGEAPPEAAVGSLLDSEESRNKLFSGAYREIGIGVADDDGGETVLVLTLGARPNVLPIFVNDGAPSTENREVAVRLTNERVRPEGSGSASIGEAIEVRINNEPEFEELAWQPWAPLVSWILPDVHGQHTVYVQFRDAAGRSTAAADGIFLDKGTPQATPGAPPTYTPPGQESPAAPSETPVAPPDGGEAGAPEAEETQTPSTSPPSRATPFPTWTPLPSPQPTAPLSEDPDVEHLSVPSLDGYRSSLTTVGILQGLAIILGLLWLLRRGRGA